MRTSVKNTSLNDAPPDICRIGRTSTPGASIGTMKAVMPACFGTSGSVRAISSPHGANRAPELHTFWPLTTHSSPSRAARVARPARSEPAPGSENSWQHNSSARRKRRTNVARCSVVPKRRTVGAISRTVTENVSCGRGVVNPRSSWANARSYSTGNPAPPNSSGHEMAP